MQSIICSHECPDVQVRHGPQLYTCNFSLEEDVAFVTVDKNDQGIAAGQYAVFYQMGVCLGSAVILEAPPKTLVA